MARVHIKNGRRLRALVVDDSVVIRRLVSTALETQPGFEVVGTAANGLIALQRVEQLNPDVITLDVEMPEMDGLATLKEVRKRYPNMVVIMVSTLTTRGASSTMDALAFGANDYVTKAATSGSLDRSMEALQRELIPKIKQFFIFGDEPARPAAAKPAVGTTAAQLARKAAAGRSKTPQVLTIGVSTGGPTALAEIMPAFPANFPLPIVMVQHMPPMFTALLADRLTLKSRLKVVEAKEGMVVQPGWAFLAPGDYHLALKRQGATVVCTLNQNPPENSCRPAVDVLFRSVEEIYGGAALAVILTGMGQDGLRGAEVLKGAGASVLAQDEASSVVWGMPGAVTRAGLADSVLPLQAIVPEILRRAPVN